MNRRHFLRLLAGAAALPLMSALPESKTLVIDSLGGLRRGVLHTFDCYTPGGKTNFAVYMAMQKFFERQENRLVKFP